MRGIITCVILIIFASSGTEVEALKSALSQANEQARVS